MVVDRLMLSLVNLNKWLNLRGLLQMFITRSWRWCRSFMLLCARVRLATYQIRSPVRVEIWRPPNMHCKPYMQIQLQTATDSVPYNPPQFTAHFVHGNEPLGSPVKRIAIRKQWNFLPQCNYCKHRGEVCAASTVRKHERFMDMHDLQFTHSP